MEKMSEFKWPPELELQKKKFFGELDSWERIVEIWLRRLARYNFSFEGKFQSVEIYDSSRPAGKPTCYSWWEAGKYRDNQVRLQQHFDERPGTGADMHCGKKFSAGDLTTLEYLWEMKSSPSMLCALLVAASLHHRVKGYSHSLFKEYWPPPFCNVFLEMLAKEELYSSSEFGFSGWHCATNKLIPIDSDDCLYSISSIEALISYLADEHVALLSGLSPTKIVFGSVKDPFIAKNSKISA